MAGNTTSDRDQALSRYVTHYDWHSLLPDIIDRLATGESLHSICKDPDMPAKGAVTWAVSKYPEYAEAYEAAKAARAELLGEEMHQLIYAMLDGSQDARQGEYIAKVISLRMGHLNQRYRDRRVEHSGKVEHDHTVAIGETLGRARERAIELSRQQDAIDVTPKLVSSVPRKSSDFT